MPNFGSFAYSRQTIACDYGRAPTHSHPKNLNADSSCNQPRTTTPHQSHRHRRQLIAITCADLTASHNEATLQRTCADLSTVVIPKRKRLTMSYQTTNSANGTPMPESVQELTASNNRSISTASASQALITPQALAAELGVGMPFVRKLAYERRLPVVKVGRYVRFKRSDIDRWLEQNTRPANVGR